MKNKSILIESLEFQANQAFVALRRAVTSKSEGNDLVWAERLYRNYRWRLESATKYYEMSTEPQSFREYTRTPHRARLYDRYIFQYLTGFACSTALCEIRSCTEEEIKRRRGFLVKDISTATDDLFESLRQGNSPYFDVFLSLSKLRECGYAKPLWKAIKLVRENYPQPKVL